VPQIGEWLRRVFDQIRGFLGAMHPRQRATFLGLALAFVAGFAAFVWWASRPVFDPVFTNLGQGDAAAIVEYLQGEKIPYRLELGGRAVLVPAEQVYDIRLALARAGLPQGSGVGFEIFDRQKLGMTDFMQRLNYSRAMQGELARTISQIAGVSAARVHLAIPERSLFVGKERRPSASVVVTLAPGRVMGAANVQGIVHLVASSVEGLSPDDVAVIDNVGRVLAGDEQGLAETGLSGSALEYQRTVERQLEERVSSMLGRVVGLEKVNVRVNAHLDLTRVETTEERVDPEQTAVLNERVSREESTDSRASGGVPGVAANLTNEAAETTAGSRSQRRDENVTYEVSKITSRTVGSLGEIKRLSVAVLVDGTYEEREGARAFVPRPAEELDRYTALVKSAVGFSEARGDTIELVSVPFDVPEEVTEGWADTALDVSRGIGTYLPRLLGVILVAGFILTVVRPSLRRLAAQPLGSRAVGAEPGSRDIDAIVSQLEEENRKITTTDPERAAYLVRQWLQQARD
jgi:flagellar M-ring protein FliF